MFPEFNKFKSSSILSKQVQVQSQTLPVSKLDCVLCHDAVAFCLRRLPAFCLKVTAFGFKTKLRFASRTFAFCSRTHCDLSQEDSEDIQCAGSDHDHYQEAASAHHEEHVMHDYVQLGHVVDSHDDYTSDSNIILCDQYVKDNEVPIIHSDLSYVPDDAFMMIYDDMCEPHDQPVSYPSRNTVVKNSLTAELATYKEQGELPRPMYNDLNKVAIGYNPLCLTRAKQAQPTLYNGHEILKDNHAPAKVHNTKGTLEIAEINRKKMNAKMTDPECVTHKVKIAPHDYSKENLLATFTP
nr:hypothetical protein [Tanacetum cinerariifolium]